MQFSKMCVIAGFLASVSFGQACNTINAIAGATIDKKFKITGGQACQDSAKINWTFEYNNGTMTMRWGTSVAYGQSGDIYSSKAGSCNPTSIVACGTFTITGLAPNTRYYYAVDGTYNNNDYIYMRSFFTTPSGVGIKSNLIDHKLELSKAVNANLYSVTGKLIASNVATESILKTAIKSGATLFVAKYYSKSGAFIGSETKSFRN